MDKTEQYIKMVNCKEIQGAEPKDERGDSLGHQLYADSHGHIAQEDDGYYYGIDEFIWLPRQDQLQEMVDEQPHNLLPLFSRFYFKNIQITMKDHKIRRMFYDDYAVQFNSMEQLWLAFVMKKKYNKTWDGENWNG